MFNVYKKLTYLQIFFLNYSKEIAAGEAETHNTNTTWHATSQSTRAIHLP